VAGDPIEFRITVWNEGEGEAENVTIRDQLPPTVFWTVSTQPTPGTCSISPTALLTCDLGDLAPSENRTVVVAAQTSLLACGQFDNAATASAENSGEVSDPGSITCTLTPPPPPPPPPPGPPPPPPPPPPPVPPPPDPELDIEKQTSIRVARPGQRIPFHLRIRNRGTETARDVRVCDRLPPGLVFDATNGGSSIGRLICFTVPRIRAGRARTFVVFTRTVLVAGNSVVVVNEAWVTARGEGPRRDRARLRVLGAAARRGGVTG
jgi:uncharacterized repeat protein (TIGR01451 family)